jgi:hypothetical protein
LTNCQIGGGNGSRNIISCFLFQLSTREWQHRRPRHICERAMKMCSQNSKIKKGIKKNFILTSYPQNQALWKYRRYLQISAKRAKQGNPPHLANAADFMKSKHEIEHDFQGDPTRRFIGYISGTKSKHEHVFRLLLNGPDISANPPNFR